MIYWWMAMENGGKEAIRMIAFGLSSWVDTDASLWIGWWDVIDSTLQFKREVCIRDINLKIIKCHHFDGTYDQGNNCNVLEKKYGEKWREELRFFKFDRKKRAIKGVTTFAILFFYIYFLHSNSSTICLASFYSSSVT